MSNAERNPQITKADVLAYFDERAGELITKTTRALYTAAGSEFANGRPEEAQRLLNEDHAAINQLVHVVFNKQLMDTNDFDEFDKLRNMLSASASLIEAAPKKPRIRSIRRRTRKPDPRRQAVFAIYEDYRQRLLQTQAGDGLNIARQELSRLARVSRLRKALNRTNP